MASAVVLTAASVGLIPDAPKLEREHHRELAETIATSSSLLITRKDLSAVRVGLMQAMQRNPDLVATTLRKGTGDQIMYLVSPHCAEAPVLEDQMIVSVPIVSAKRDWGTLDLAFRPTRAGGFWGWLATPLIRLLTFFGIATFVCFMFYMRSTLRYLDPKKVMPSRVRQALDTLADGLMIVDQQDRIVHTNAAFQKLLGFSDGELRGRLASQLPWHVVEELDSAEMPWTKSIRDASVETSVRVRLVDPDGADRTFLVNSSSIADDDGASRGAIVSLDDVTDLELNRIQLQRMLDDLEKSQDDIQKRNEELELVASTDPLTGCLNRRAFYADFEVIWNRAVRDGAPLSCAMTDVDHFKSVNDRLGHSAGDLVLQSVAEAIRENVRDKDLVCRYGGEEFCVLMPGTGAEQARQVAERIRQAIAGLDCIDVPVTASFGISAREYGAGRPAEMLDQADRCCIRQRTREEIASSDGVQRNIQSWRASKG